VSWLTDPWGTELVSRAGIELALVGVLGGVLGVFVVVRGLPYTVEAFAHTVLPGAVLATVLGGSVLLGGLAAAGAAAIGIALASRHGATNEDTAVGVVFTGMFALGVLLAAALGPLDRDLTSFLFGSVLGVSRGDLLLSAGATLLVLAVVAALWRPLVATAFDREAAAGAGVRVARLDALLLALIALAVVVAVRAIGNVLVLAMFVAPAASARLVCRRLPSTVAASAGYGVVSGIGGLYLSFHAGLAAGGSVVLVATGLFAVTWLASPRAGLPAVAVRARTERPARS
jgi:manganese/iron transport system permease protein